MATMDEEYVYNVQLHDETKKPERSRPDGMMRFGKQVDNHGQLRQNIQCLIVKRAAGHHIHHGESHQSYCHHAKKFEIMIAHETPHGQMLLSAVFAGQSVTAEQHEKGHTIMPQQGEQVEGQQAIGMEQLLPHAMSIAAVEGKLILTNDATQPMTVVVQHYGKDCHTSHHRTLGATEPMCFRVCHLDVLEDIRFSIYRNRCALSTVWGAVHCSRATRDYTLLCKNLH